MNVVFENNKLTVSNDSESFTFTVLPNIFIFKDKYIVYPLQNKKGFIVQYCIKKIWIKYLLPNENDFTYMRFLIIKSTPDSYMEYKYDAMESDSFILNLDTKDIIYKNEIRLNRTETHYVLNHQKIEFMKLLEED